MSRKNLISNFSRVLALLTVLALIVGVAFSSVNMPRALAESIQQQIDNLEQQNAEFAQQKDRLEDQAVSYKDAIAKLAAKIDELQGKINDNLKTQQELKTRIVETEKELNEQRGLLGINIKVMYLEGQLSTLEVLASSENLSDFVNKEEYRTSVQKKIKETLDKITALKHELSIKKQAVDELLTQQTKEQAELSGARQEQSNLLAYNQAQQAEYDRKTRDNNKKIAQLIAQQQQAIDSIGPGSLYFLRFPGNPGKFNPEDYPWRNAGFSMQTGPCSFTDSWPDSPDGHGYCTRQCVSYAAWAVAASGRSYPEFYGSARNWVNAAIAHGIPVYRVPQPGDVAISTSGYWGHAMYVESVDYENHTFTTSEYNTHLDGRLYYKTRSF